MNKYHFIGDIHGNTQLVTKIGNRYRDDNVIQIGDFGIGFTNDPEHLPKLPANCRFIRGNHDDPSLCKKHPQWVKDGHTEITPNGTKMMFVGGAWSIDWRLRTPGVSWWEDEQLSYSELNDMVDQYLSFKPDVMITHDAPQSVAQQMFLTGTHKPLYPSRTSMAFDSMFESHKPMHWLFGHWHLSMTADILGTQFRCINTDSFHSYKF